MVNSRGQGAMVVTVTGGSGFVGTELVRALLSLGYTVRILDKQKPDEPLPPVVTFYEGDIMDVHVVEEAIRGADLVYHIAALVPISKKSSAEFHRVNVDGTRNVLEAALASHARVIFCSTSSPLYDSARTFPVNEETPKSPAYFYGRSKFAAEAVCREFRQKGLQIAIVRPRMLIGPGRLGLIEILSEWIRRGDPVPVLGNGSNRLQFLDVRDFTDLLVRSLVAPPHVFNEDYNVGAKEFGTLREDLAYVIAKAQSRSPIVCIPRFYRPILASLNLIGVTPFTFFHVNTIDRTFYFDTTKAQQNLGWIPRYSNAEGLFASYRWYVEHRERLSTGEGHRKKLRNIGLLRTAPPLLRFFASLSRASAWIVDVIATGGGLGRIAPIARSSFGALLGIVGVPYFLLLSMQSRIIVLIALVLGAVAVAGISEKHSGIKDDNRIVIDEIASVYITFFALPLSAASIPILVLGFVLNRFFDIAKPYPARAMERLAGGWGIVMDDVISSAYSALVLMLLIALLF